MACSTATRSCGSWPGAGRTVAYAVDHAFRQADRSGGRRALGVRMRRGKLDRRPLADSVVEQDGEVVLARAAAPATDPSLVLRAAAAAAQVGLPLAPRALARLAECPPLPIPWPADARNSLLALLGAGPSAIAVWEALDQEGLLAALIPDWDRVRNRPQRNPLHRFTVDRHLVECAANAAALARDVSRPDLLLLAALLHDIGKGWPGDHSVSGEVVARDVCKRVGLSEPDTELVAAAVRHHLLLPSVATRRDLDDPVTVRQVAATIGSRTLLELLHALSAADGLATGPAAWNDWKAGLVADLVRRVSAVLDGEPMPGPVPLREDQLALVADGGPAAIVDGTEVTVVALDRPGLLWRAAGVLASHRLAVRGANASAVGDTAVTVFSVVPEYGDPPDAALVTADLRRMLEGRLDVEDRLERRARAVRAHGTNAPPPKVTLVDDASTSATVVEVRAHDEPGLLWRIGRALGECGLNVQRGPGRDARGRGRRRLLRHRLLRRPADRPRPPQADGHDSTGGPHAQLRPSPPLHPPPASSSRRPRLPPPAPRSPPAAAPPASGVSFTAGVPATSVGGRAPVSGQRGRIRL